MASQMFEKAYNPEQGNRKAEPLLLFTGQECAELRIPQENVQLEKQKSICEANFAWIFACC